MKAFFSFNMGNVGYISFLGKKRGGRYADSSKDSDSCGGGVEGGWEKLSRRPGCRLPVNAKRKDPQNTY